MADQHHLIRRHYGEGRPAGDRIADRFVSVFGSWSYIIWQTIVIVLWMTGNAWFLRSLGTGKVPDPYPFILLNLGFSAQASYAAPLILMAQNRQADRDKDFATHQFHLIEHTDSITVDLGTLLARNTDLTKTVHDLTAEVHRLVVQQALEPVHTETLAAVAADVKAARQSSEAAFAGVQALAAIAVKPAGIPLKAPEDR